MDQNVIQAIKLQYRKNLLKKVEASDDLGISETLKNYFKRCRFRFK